MPLFERLKRLKSKFLTLFARDSAKFLIFRESVWENLARMCVLTRRADVAKICLGKMGLFRGARALRAVDQDNPDTKIAILAIHLNMRVSFRHCLKK